MNKTTLNVSPVNPFADIADMTGELVFAVNRMEAVAQCFSEDYVDVQPDELLAEIKARCDHYTALYNALYYMLVDVSRQAKALDGSVSALFRQYHKGA